MASPAPSRAKAGEVYKAVVFGSGPQPAATSAGSQESAFLIQQVSARAASIRTVRIVFGAWIGGTCPGIDVDDAVLVLDELVTNGVRFAPATMLVVSAEAHIDGSVTFEVWDSAPPPAAIAHQLPDMDAEGGRGLFIAFELAESVELVHVPVGTLVRARMGAAA